MTEAPSACPRSEQPHPSNPALDSSTAAAVTRSALRRAKEDVEGGGAGLPSPPLPPGPAWKRRLRLANRHSVGVATRGPERKGGRVRERRGCLGDAGGALGGGEASPGCSMTNRLGTAGVRPREKAKERAGRV